MHRPRASGTLRIETVFHAFVGANSAAEVTIRRLDETFSVSRKFTKTEAIENDELESTPTCSVDTLTIFYRNLYYTLR